MKESQKISIKRSRPLRRAFPEWFQADKSGNMSGKRYGNEFGEISPASPPPSGQVSQKVARATSLRREDGRGGDGLEKGSIRVCSTAKKRSLDAAAAAACTHGCRIDSDRARRASRAADRLATIVFYRVSRPSRRELSLFPPPLRPLLLSPRFPALPANVYPECSK